MREELAEMTNVTQTAMPPTEAPEVEVLTDAEESKSSESLLNAESPVPSDKKEEGVAAEAAATAVVEESSVAPHVEIPEQHAPSAQVMELQSEISSLHGVISEKDAAITSLKTELKEVMVELV